MYDRIVYEGTWYTTGKNMEYFSFQRFFCILCGVGYILFWYTFLQTDITLGKLINTQ